MSAVTNSADTAAGLHAKYAADQRRLREHEQKVRAAFADKLSEPVLDQATAAICAYLADERELGRIAADADINSLALSPVGGGHLVFADRDPGPQATAVVNKPVTAVIADAVPRRPA